MNAVHQLLTACEEGDVSTVQALLDHSLDVNSTDDGDVTALQVAAANGHEHVVRLLLMRGATLDKSNSTGWTPLLLASRHGHVQVLSILLQNQADVNARTKLGTNSITLAARGGHIQTCRLLIEAGIDMHPAAGIMNSACEFSPLMVAAHHGHDAVVRQMLDRGQDVNYRTPSTGINALMLAALNGHMTTSQILIERGANPNLTNVNGHTPLHVASRRKRREVRGYLDRKTTNKPKLSSEDAKSDILEAAKRGDIERISDILDKDLTQRDVCSAQDGATSLMFAAMTGRLDIAQLLVEKGCDINKQDTISGWTALMQATYHGKKAVAKYLINADANVLIPAKNGCTAFDMASLIDDIDTELYRMLAAKAVQISRPDRKGKAWSPKQNGQAVRAISMETIQEKQPTGGLKAWWSRMSNRFRNLKLGRTFNLNSNRLAPLPSEIEDNDATLKRKSSPKEESARKSVSTDCLNTTSSSSMSTITNYETILLETKRTASMYTLGLSQPNVGVQDGTLKPVIPPFLPPPTFESDRPKMPPVSSRRSVASLGSTSTLTSTRPIVPPVKLLQSYSSSTQNLATAPVGGGDSLSFINGTSTTPAAHLAGGIKSRGPSSASSSTLTASSDNLSRNGGGLLSRTDMLFSPVSRVLPVRPAPFSDSQTPSSTRPSALMRSSHISPTSSTSGSSSITPRRHSKGKSGSSKDSTSTLTPSPSPTPKPADLPGSNSNSSLSNTMPSSTPEEDDLGGILKELSLEKYQPIFEEQEVDMEAFLTLTDQDLKELGIAQPEPRRQILAAIVELNSGKGRERRRFEETMFEFHSSLRSRPSYSSGSQLEYPPWNIHGTARPGDSGSKSRSS